MRLITNPGKGGYTPFSFSSYHPLLPGPSVFLAREKLLENRILQGDLLDSLESAGFLVLYAFFKKRRAAKQ